MATVESNGRAEESHAMTPKPKSFAELQKEWISRRQQNPKDLFYDEEFPPKHIPTIMRNSRSGEGTVLGRNLRSANVTWKRAPEIARTLEKPPRLVVDGVTLFDLNQGVIGNCWYIAGAAHLAERPGLWKMVVPRNQDFDELYGGIFHFKLWHFGEWVEVIVDDYLPCFTNQYGQLQLFFVRNYREPNEFWSPLLEKAYAKLHGSYERLVGGFSKNAMVDVTGGVGIFESTEKWHQNLDAFYELMTTLAKHDTLFGSGISQGGLEESRQDGLLARHAYTITKVTEIKDVHGNRHRMVKLRNPHGKGGSEWNGAWSDADKTRWASVVPEDNHILQRYNPRDGEFWMSFEDFMRAFELIEVCFLPKLPPLPNEPLPAEGWNIHTFPRHAWVKKVNAGGKAKYWKNPQFQFDIIPKSSGTDETTMYVSLMKITSPSLQTYAEHLNINFHVYAILDDKERRLDRSYKRRARLIATGTNISNYSFRELTLPVTVSAGRYCVVPFVNSSRSGSEAQFLLRVLTNDDYVVYNTSHDPVPERRPPGKPMDDDEDYFVEEEDKSICEVCCCLCLFLCGD